MRTSARLVSLFVAGVVLACKDPPSQPLAMGVQRTTFGLISNGAAEALGGLDLVTYCQSLGFARLALLKPRYGPNAAYNNWRCATESGEVHPFSFEQACKFQYGLEAVQAHPTDPDDAFTWVCYTSGNIGNGPVALGGLDLVTYCQSLGFARLALLKPRFGPNAAYNNWRCETESGEVHPFSFEQACKFHYGLEAVQAHPTDPDDAFTWVCYAVGND